MFDVLILCFGALLILFITVHRGFYRLAAFFVALAVLSSAVVGIMHELLFRENIVSIAQLTLAAGGRPPPSHRGS
jgi:hypothetical protein